MNKMDRYQKISSRILQRLNKFSKSSRSRYGIPFVLFVVCGSFGLKEFTSIKYKYGDRGVLVHDEAKKAGIDVKEPGEVTLEKVYDTIKDIDIENWENKRGPRPWEENFNNN